MPYESFLISDLTEGKVTRRDAWLLPSDGFETLFNCHLKRGRLEKRRGRSLLGQIVKINTATLNPTLRTNPVVGVANYLSGSTEELISFDKERMNTFVDSKVSGVILVSVSDQGGSPNVARFVVASGHGISADDIVTISNTTNYDGTFRVEAEAATTFDIESAFTAETMGVTSQVNQEQFTDNSKLQVRFDATAQAFEPTPGATIEQPVGFHWQDVSDPSGASYTLQVAADSGFSTLLVDEEVRLKRIFLERNIIMMKYENEAFPHSFTNKVRYHVK